MGALEDRDLARLRCVDCHDILLKEGEELILCSSCRREFRIEQGAWAFMPSGSEDPRLRRWDERLKLFARWRRERIPSTRPAAAGVSLLEKFGKFTAIDSGRVLDIGCASGEIRNHFRCDEYWGIDPMPLEGSTTRMFKGIGENLPFLEETFDHVILSQVLDHCVEPSRLLEEVARVACPGGKVHVLQYVIDQDRRWSGYLLARVRRLLGIQARVHSWETKLRLLTREEVRHLVESSPSLDCLHSDDQVHDAQVFLTAVVRR
jgi:SAM-dependent methyltransferase